ncbi:monosaccharide ABC transporter ATP-binding protein, CUT2 family [Sulfitobacter marinus]|uniref:Monosaccharide ABC transporter ATP-binding protein, CUT2 family n=1 Tax=Sulfitobacter marinus TaxID=394264 RepID=A0A1I6R096_9RHOB|nr:sugar ABC transporter ATP-binding protein [Sulfitobacter marinus]SFS58082.1 monosaccharide ABC transporter ATP-binding protein, CUT2 family [Sulfitobacter marinus]
MAMTSEEMSNDPVAVETLPPTLRLRNISKVFGATKALDNVSLDVLPGEVHGLLGTNGSGKSTLIKVLAGYHSPEPGGTLEFNSDNVKLPLRPEDFRRLGMSFVHQDLGLVPSLTVLENLRIAEIALAKGGLINWKHEKAAAKTILERYDVNIEIWRRVDELSAVNRALLAIVRAFEDVRRRSEETGKPGLVLLDEPTPFLPRESVNQLFDLVRRIAEQGSSAIFISHDIDEVMEFTDKVTVLRDGRVSGQAETKTATHDDMVELIIGRRLEKTTTTKTASTAKRTVLAKFSDISSKTVKARPFEIGKGEIIGMTGLIGSGYEQLPYLMFGAQRADAGTVQIEGQSPIVLSGLTPKAALEHQFALLPGDRLEKSGVGSISIFENMLLPGITDYSARGFLNNAAMKKEARRLGAQFEVRPNNPEAPLGSLSGGNAQKVLIAKWMKRNPKLLLLDEPTQGVDVGTRDNIFKALRAAAQQGMSIVCASSDAEQLEAVCDRVLIFARGRIIDELTGARLTKDEIMQACYGSLSKLTETDRSQEVIES